MITENMIAPRMGHRNQMTAGLLDPCLVKVYDRADVLSDETSQFAIQIAFRMRISKRPNYSLVVIDRRHALVMLRAILGELAFKTAPPGCPGLLADLPEGHVWRISVLPKVVVGQTIDLTAPPWDSTVQYLGPTCLYTWTPR